MLLHASVSRRTRFPALRELYSGALGRLEPNPALGPEELQGAELGMTVHRGGAELQAVAFHQRLYGGIVRVSVETPEGPKLKRVNQDEIRSTGLELMGRGPLGSVVLSADVTLQHARGFDADGGRVQLEYQPAVTGGVGLQMPLPLDALGAADLDFTGRQSCRSPEEGGLIAFESDPRLDLSVRRRFGGGDRGAMQRLEARLEVENVADATVLDQCGLPGPGRLLSLQVRLW
jgi:iron complex outermembrane receptor protein